MSTEATQANRPMKLTTPLGKDVLLLTNFMMREGISQLFQMQLDVIAKNGQEVAFDKLLGQKVSVELVGPGNKPRFFSGIVNRVSQGGRDQTFTRYRLEAVPQLWLLTKRWQSRIFQHLNVPDILKKVLEGLDPTLELQGTFEPRDYCVQYRESDFNFASRLMEEEGIYYFFKHAADGHKLVVANAPGSHPEMPMQSKVIYEEISGGQRDDLRIFSWSKVQELRAGKVTLWDQCFELPKQHLEADKTIQESVQVGTVTHKLKLPANEKLELYDFPGEYAQRFDGVDRGGGDKPKNLDKIFTDNKRTTNIRMEQEAVPGLVIQGSSNCRQFVCGHRFTLDRHFNANGQYLLTSVTHVGRQGAYLSGGDGSTFEYSNSFTCIPFAQPFRPPRVALKPTIQGAQTAIVVGMPGEEIFADKYGRVKVQFPWDRQGKYNADSSCWVRVGQVWAGKHWGASFVPRIGQEVIVLFQEADPDQPIIVGSVYNAEQMPPYGVGGNDSKHKDPRVCGIKSNTTQGGKGFNEWRFDDTKDKEQIFIHAERNMDVRVKNESMTQVLNHQHLTIGSEKDNKKTADQRELVYQDKHLNVKRHQVEKIEGNFQLTIGKGGESSGGNMDLLVEKNKKELVEANSHIHVKGTRSEKVDGSQSLTVGGDQQEKVKNGHLLEAGTEIHLKSGATLVIEAQAQLTLKVGGNFIDISPAGIAIQGTMVMINSGGAAGTGRDANPAAPEDAKEAKPTKPTEADNALTGSCSKS